MAFQTSTASGMDDVIQQFIIFAVANAGFSDSGSIIVPGSLPSGFSNGRTMYRCSKGGLTWGFSRVRASATLPDLGFHIQYGFNAAIDKPESDVANTPDRSSFVSCWNFPGPYSNVYMFTDGVSVHCCIELASGIYTHMAIGSITKTEVFDGGEFMAGICGHRIQSNLYDDWDSSFMSPLFPGARLDDPPSGGALHPNSPNYSHIRSIPLSGAVTGYNRFARFSATSIGGNNIASGEAIDGMSYQWGHKYENPTFGLQVNSQNQRTPFWPNIIRLDHQINNLWRVSGHTPVMQYCFLDYLDPGDIVLNDWQVFPFSEKNGDRTQAPNSGGLGIAYKRA